jgi:hypothetical protein
MKIRVPGRRPDDQMMGSGVAVTPYPQRGHPFAGGAHQRSPHVSQSNQTGTRPR